MRAERVEILREGFRIIRPGGRLFAFDPSAHSPSMWLYRDPRSPFSRARGRPRTRSLSPPELRDDLEEAGFSVVRGPRRRRDLLRYVEDRFARRILPLYNLYEEALRFSPFEDRLGTFLVSFAVKPA